jgi:F0F1-type ATP synthase assembly protein I
MTTEKTKNSQNMASATSQQSESKKELNQKTSVEFSVSVVLGVLIIVLLAATAYYGIVH